MSKSKRLSKNLIENETVIADAKYSWLLLLPSIVFLLIVLICLILWINTNSTDNYSFKTGIYIVTLPTVPIMIGFLVLAAISLILALKHYHYQPTGNNK